MSHVFSFFGVGRADTCADGRVVSNFIMQALSGDDITIYGDGGQTRSFCFVDDLIEGLVRLMNNESEVSQSMTVGEHAHHRENEGEGGRERREGSR